MIFGVSTGLEPVASAFAQQCSTNLAMKTHSTLGAGQFIEFIDLYFRSSHHFIQWMYYHMVTTYAVDHSKTIETKFSQD